MSEFHNPKNHDETDDGRFYCTDCDYTTVDIFQIGCPKCGGSLFLPVEKNPIFHSEDVEK